MKDQETMAATGIDILWLVLIVVVSCLFIGINLFQKIMKRYWPHRSKNKAMGFAEVLMVAGNYDGYYN